MAETRRQSREIAGGVHRASVVSWPRTLSRSSYHQSVRHPKNEWVRGDVHTNTIESVWPLLKRSITGSYHHVSIDHLPAYLDELEWKYNNRRNPYLFRDTLIRLCESEVLGYQELIA